MTKTRTSATFFPPVMEARRWLEGVTHPADRPLINVSQAAPVDPPVKELRQAMADAALNDDGAHLYGPVLGNVALRQALATKTTSHYEVQLQLITSQSPLAVIRRLPPPFHRFALRGMKSSFQPHGILIIKCGWTCLGLHLYLCQLALIYCQVQAKLQN